MDKIENNLNVTRIELVDIWNLITELKNRQDKALTYYIERDISLVEDEIKSISALQESSKPTESFIEFENKRLEICKKYADKDKDGNPIIIGDNYLFTTYLEVFNNELSKLREDYKDTIVEYDRINNTFTSLMKEEIQLQFKKIPFSLLPNDMSYNRIKKIVKETEEEIEKIIEKTLI